MKIYSFVSKAPSQEANGNNNLLRHLAPVVTRKRQQVVVAMEIITRFVCLLILRRHRQRGREREQQPVAVPALGAARSETLEACSLAQHKSYNSSEQAFGRGSLERLPKSCWPSPLIKRWGN